MGYQNNRFRAVEYGFLEPRHPVAALRPGPVVLKHSLRTMLSLPQGLPVIRSGIQPSGQDQHRFAC